MSAMTDLWLKTWLDAHTSAAEADNVAQFRSLSAVQDALQVCEAELAQQWSQVLSAEQTDQILQADGELTHVGISQPSHVLEEMAFDEVDLNGNAGRLDAPPLTGVAVTTSQTRAALNGGETVSELVENPLPITADVPVVVEAAPPTAEAGVVNEVMAQSDAEVTPPTAMLPPATVPTTVVIGGLSHTESDVAMPISPTAPQATPIQSPNYRIVLPNARQSEDYASAVVLKPTVNSVISKMEFAPECGLYWDAERQLCVGVPTINGDVAVRVWWHGVQNSAAPQHELTQTTLYINADPKSLWRDIPSDSNTPFWKSDAASMGIDRAYSMVAARVRGRSHAHVGSCCDDDFAIEHLAGEFPAYLAIVADGAGSAAYSRLGSKVAVGAALNSLKQLLQSDASVQFLRQQTASAVVNEASWQDYVESVLSRAAYDAYMAQTEALKQNAATISDIKQLSSTLLIGLSLPLPNKQWLVGAYWVGDGAIALYRPEQSVVVLGEADSGEFSGQTCFLSKDELATERLKQRIQYRVIEGEHALILMTDGVSDPKFDSEQDVSDATQWHGLWQEWTQVCQHSHNAAEAAAQLQQWLAFWSPGHHDDRSLVIVSPALYAGTEQVAAETERT